MDLRIRVTKELLKNSLIELIEIKEYNKITIKEICERANVNRTTFYKYYNDVDSLLLEIEDDIFKIIKNELKDNHDINRILDVLLINNKYTKVLLVSSPDESFKYKLLDIIDFAIPKINNYNDEYRDFFYNGIYSLIVNWLNQKYKIGLEEMGKIITNLFNSLYNN